MKQAANRIQRGLDVILILIVSMIAYVPLVNKLGYYRDDWHVTWGGMMIGAEKIIDLHLTDRPFMGLIYSFTYSVLGSSPLVWQLYVVVLRIVGGLLLLWLLRLLWPARRMATTLMALLFTIYPGFLQMPTSSAYSNHLFGFAMGILSLILSIKAVQSSRLGLRIGFVLASIVSGLVCYLIMEYMISLEGVRIILLGYLFVRYDAGTLPKKGLRLFKMWAPYLAGLALFLVWRILIFKSARATTDVGSLASTYLSDPGYMTARILIETIKGAINALFMAWSVPLYYQTMAANPTNLLVAFVLILAATAVFLTFLRLFGAHNDLRIEAGENKQWGKEAVVLGLLITLINIIPVVLANREIRLTDTLDRYTLPASIGVVMYVIGLLYWMVRGSLRVPVIVALLAISIFTHYNSTAFFANFWAVQKQLWWQLAWRAPNLKSDTVLIPALPSPFMLAESYEVWGPANIIYGTRQNPLRVVGEAINTESMHSILTKDSFTRTMRRVEFTLDFKNSLVVSIPSLGSCLHVFDREWLEFSENESLLVRQVAPSSNISLIETEGSQKMLPAEVFGEEPQHTWCYYYAKADLARQKQDWNEVVRLGDEARAKGLQPNDTMEWMPFYQGYAYTRRMDDANEMAYLIRGERIALKEFCNQFSQERVSALGSGSIDEFIIINLCPQ